MTDAERISEIRATMDDGDAWIAKHVPWLLSVIAERDADIAGVRRMFDVTRHRICDAMAEEHGKSWSSLESMLAEYRARIAKLEAAIRQLASAHGDQPMIAQPSPGAIDVTTVRDFCEEALR